MLVLEFDRLVPWRLSYRKSKTRGGFHRGLRSIAACLVDDAEALAAGRNRRRRLILGIDLGRDRDDAVLLARLGGGVARDREELDRARSSCSFVALPVTRVDDLVLEVATGVFLRAPTS